LRRLVAGVYQGREVATLRPAISPPKEEGWKTRPTATDPDGLRKLKRVVGSGGKAVRLYVDAAGTPLPLQPQQHHQGANAGFIPPPS
jgi:hypothetical protein